MDRNLALLMMFAAAGCERDRQAGEEAQACVPVASVADYVHTVIEADRTTYAEKVVHRLQNVDKVIEASESFEEQHALPLPSQMLRMAAATAARKNQGKLRYALISEWAINKANMPKTDFEKAGLKALAKNPERPYRGLQTAGPQRYFAALYPDRAVSQACVDCHNAHPESPRSDFTLGEVMDDVAMTLQVD